MNDRNTSLSNSERIKELEQQFNQSPDDLNVIEELALAHIELGKTKQAEDYAILAIEAGSNNPAILSFLINHYRSKGNDQLANQYIKAKLDRQKETIPFSTIELDRTAPIQQGMQVICFTFKGRNKDRLTEALETLNSAAILLPNWSKVVCCDNSVPMDYIAALQSTDADIFMMPQQQRQGDDAWWPWKLLNDKTISHLFFADIKMPFSISHYLMIEQWLKSDRDALVMRHDVEAIELVPAKAFAVKNCFQYSRPEDISFQNFLNTTVWKSIRHNVLEYDIFFDSPAKATNKRWQNIGLGKVYDYPDDQPILRPIRRGLVFTCCLLPQHGLFLAQLLKKCRVKAEIYGPRFERDDFGKTHPPIALIADYNLDHNHLAIETFWRQQFNHISQGVTPFYIDTTHTYWLSGMMEHLPDDMDIHLIIPTIDHMALTRALIINRSMSKAFWNHNLYPSPEKGFSIINAKPLLKFGEVGRCFWMAAELLARQQVIQKLRLTKRNITFQEFQWDKLNDKKQQFTLLNNLGITYDETQIGKIFHHGTAIRLTDRQEALLARLATINVNIDKLATAYAEREKRRHAPK